MNSSGERLKALLQECNLTASDFAAQRQVSPQHVNNWFKRGVPLARLDEISDLLCVHRRWLHTGEGPKYLNPIPRLCTPCPRHAPHSPSPSALMCHDGQYSPIPLYRVCDGQLEPVPGGNLRLPLRAFEALGVAPSDAVCLSMPAHNMTPTLPHGSTLAIDRSLTRIVEGETYALLHGGQLRVNTLSLTEKGVLCLHSHDNRNHPPERLTALQCRMQGVEIIGWVFWWAHLRPGRPE
ncbi:HTH-type transcriptional regulator PrtR [Pseudomonas fluorescens]|uniref:LexA family transcriptional regulator n=1 Tax=Pseudomonas fluorescens TaxID=294 RepID=UPI001253B72A|nr:XRE family transcriptional regulator [Pseudomonas fluorescens]CAG8868346.1 HTH-type transcriptional regulator PrtR [Pseudomonas fluorescens]VVQ04278.1 HTH-type transcriptional regulator PrtR [Pseudomonas fluorescens]